MIRVAGPFNSGASVGGNGVATANATSKVEISGYVVGVYVKYNDAPPAGTTDVTIATLGTSPAAPSRTILTLTDTATDGWFYPQANVCSTAAANQAAIWTKIPIADYVKVTIDQANAADNVDVWLMIAEA